MAEQDTQEEIEDTGPVVRPGDVFESLAPEDDELGGGRRRVRVELVEDGKVQARNPVTGVVSHIDAGNMCPPRWRRSYP